MRTQLTQDMLKLIQQHTHNIDEKDNNAVAVALTEALHSTEEVIATIFAAADTPPETIKTTMDSLRDNIILNVDNLRQPTQH